MIAVFQLDIVVVEPETDVVAVAEGFLECETCRQRTRRFGVDIEAAAGRDLDTWYLQGVHTERIDTDAGRIAAFAATIGEDDGIACIERRVVTASLGVERRFGDGARIEDAVEAALSGEEVLTQVRCAERRAVAELQLQCVDRTPATLDRVGEVRTVELLVRIHGPKG